MSTFGYGRELKKYEEVDEDELLASLSSEELQELERELADLQPDHDVPIGLRQKDHTAKIPTGGFDRDALLRYWEEENQRLLQEEGEKETSDAGQEERPDKSRGEPGSAAKTVEIDRKKISSKEKKTNGVSRGNETKAEKTDECKKTTPNRSKRPQTKDLRTETEEEPPNLTSERPSGNPIHIDETLEQVLGNDPSVKEVNLNNIEDISQETLLRFAEALCTNTQVHVFSLANTRADDRVAFAVSKMLCENRSVRNLNVESNFLSGKGVLALLAALKHNTTLVELRFHNQRHICGGKAEMEMVQLLRDNDTLLKLGYQFDLPGPRMTATGILTRNQDRQRQRRLQEKQKQNPPQSSGQVSGSPAENRTSKKTTQSSKVVEKQNRNLPPPPPPSLDPPTRTIAEMVKHHDGSNGTKVQWNQKKPKSKKLKNGANEKESADILKDLKNSLKPSPHKRGDEPPAQRSSRDDLMAAIRGSSIGALKRVDLSQT